MTPQELAVIGIDSATIAYVYTWGFGTVLSSWFLGFCVAICLKLINKV